MAAEKEKGLRRLDTQHSKGENGSPTQIDLQYREYHTLAGNEVCTSADDDNTSCPFLSICPKTTVHS